MSDQSVLLPKRFTHGGIILVKGQLGYSFAQQGFGEMSLWGQLSKKHSDGPSRIQNEYSAVQCQMGCEVLCLESIYVT